MGNEASAEQGAPGEDSLKGQASSPGNFSASNEADNSPTERSSGREIPDLSISASMDEFTTPTATPSASARPSPSVSARTSPFPSRINSSESLQSYQSSARQNTTTETSAADNDTMDAKPKSALHEHIMIAPDEAEDHAWMDPVLAAAAAGAASKKSRDAMQAQAQSFRPSSFGIRIDDDWKESLQKLASTTRSTAISFAHVAAPVLSEAADTVKKSAWGELNQFTSRESDNRGRGTTTTTTTTTGDNAKHGYSSDSNDQAPKSDNAPSVELSESFERLTSSKKSAACSAFVAAAATPVLIEGTDATMNSVVDKNGGDDNDSVSSRQMPEADTGVLVDEKLRGSFQRFASTTQSAAIAFVHVAKPVLSEASDVLKESVPMLAEATELVRKSVMEFDEESNQVPARNKMSTSNSRDQMNGVAAHNDPSTVSNAVQAKPVNVETAAVEDDWRKSLARFATTAKSATTSLSHLASPILEETVDVLKTAKPYIESDSEMGKYGGVGYRPIVRDEMNESTAEWKGSLQRLASTTKSTATSLVAVASSLISEDAETVIESIKEAAEGYQVPTVGNNEAIESGRESKIGCNDGSGSSALVEQLGESEPTDSLNTSQGYETVLASPGWHDKKTPLRSHREPLADGHATGSADSLATPGSFDETKSTVSRDTKSPPQRTRQRDRDDCTSVASLSVASARSQLSSRRRNQDGRNKNSISSPGRLVEMVSKRLAPENSVLPPTRGGRVLGGQRMSGSASRTGSITSVQHIFDSSTHSIFQDERQPETSKGLSPPGSPEQSGSIAASVLNTPPRLLPAQEVTLWDMFPKSESQIVGEGSFVIEPRARVVLESSAARFDDDLRPGSTYSSEEESLPMSTGFIGKRMNTYDSNDTASDPGLMSLKKNRKLRRGSHLQFRGSRNSCHPPALSPSSSAIFVDSLNLDARSTFEDLSPDAEHVHEAPSFRSPDAIGETTVQTPNGVPDRTLDEALMAFSLLPNVDFLSELSTQSIQDPLQSLASIRWRQLTANWEHDEMMKAITMRPCSIHSFSELYEHEEVMRDWSDSWTTTAYNTKRNLQFSVQEEFRKTQKATPLMNNLSGFNPLLVDGQFQYLTPYLTRIGPTSDCNGVISKSSKFMDSRNGSVLKHSMGTRKNIVIKDLLTSAISKSSSYLTLLKDIATFATNNSDPATPARAVRYSVDVKTAGAIKEKAKRKYNGDILQVKDILRGQITFPSESSLVCAMSSLYGLCDPGNSDEAIKIVRIKNLFQKMPAKSCLNDCLPTGYRHVLITIKFHDGFLAEIQLQLAQMFDVLGQDGYDLHKEITNMDAAYGGFLVPRFSRYPYNCYLKTILNRVFNGLGQANNTKGKIGELTYISSPSVLPIEGVNGVSTSKIVSSRQVQNASKEDVDEETKGNTNDSKSARPPPFLAGGGIAAAAAAAAQARNKEKASKDESSDETKVDDDNSRPSPPLFLAGGGIAAAAAAAAQARNKEKPSKDESSNETKVDDDDSRPRPPLFLAGGGIAAAAAAAAQAQNKEKASKDESSDETKVDDDNSKPSPPPFLAGGGIAAAAAAAAQARNKEKPSKDESSDETKVDDDDSRPSPPLFLAGGGIAAAAAAAAQARNKEKASKDESSNETKVDDDDSRPRPPPFLAGGGIAAAAAAAAQARNKEKASKDESSDETKVDDDNSKPSPPPFLAGGGIAAAAAAAAQARKKEKASKDESSDETKVDDDKSRPSPPPFLAGGGIAAAAAAAAQARNKEKASKDESSDETKVDDDKSRPSPPPFLAGGGIAAAAAAAAQARNKEKASKDESSDETKVDDDNSRPSPPSFLAGGGIAAAAATAAQARNNEKPSKDDSGDETKVDDDDSRPSPPSFLAGGGIAAAAAAAAQARNKEKASKNESSDETKVDDAAAQARSNEKLSKDISSGEMKVDDDENFNGLFRPFASALDGALQGFHGKSSKDESISNEGMLIRKENALKASSARPSEAQTENTPGFDFSDREIVRAVVLEALKDASVHSCRISTLYCAASLCFLLASGTEFAASDSKKALSKKGSPPGQSEAESTTDPANAVQHTPTAQSHKTTDDIDHGSSNELGENNEPTDTELPDVSISNATKPSNGDSIEQEEKRRAHEDPGSPPLFHRMFGSKKSTSLKGEKLNAQSVSTDTKRVPNEIVADIAKQTSMTDSNYATGPPSRQSRQFQRKSDDKTSGNPVVSSPVDEINEESDKPESIEKHEGAGSSQPFELTILVDLSERALLRGLTIANQASSRGMIGWLQYGSSTFLDRTARRPLDIIGRLAYHHAIRKDWQVAEDLMRTFVLRCEQHLPLYHPVTLSAMLDLASTCVSSSEHVLARHLLDQISKRLSFYLNEQESAYFDYQASLRRNGVDVAFQPLTGADHVSMLRSFTSLFEELLDRDYAQLFGGENEVLLINHCLVGDSFSVLANCLQSSETSRENKRKSLLYCDSITYWSTAFRHYRLAFEGWTRKGFDLSHPNVSGVACSMARCLRELGETEKACLVLTSVVGATGGKDEIPIVVEAKDENEHHPFEEKIFLPRETASVIRSRGCAQEATALRLWYMAAYAVESCPDERGRIRALSLLHASSEALQERLREVESISEKSTSNRAIELLNCVEDEARALFAPLHAMREEKRPRIELIEEAGGNRDTDAETTLREQYPTRHKVHQTSTKANFLPSAFA